MNNQSLRILNWNANDINKKLLEHGVLIQKTKTDIILLEETKLNTKTPLKLSNFITYCTDNTPRVGSLFIKKMLKDHIFQKLILLI